MNATPTTLQMSNTFRSLFIASLVIAVLGIAVPFVTAPGSMDGAIKVSTFLTLAWICFGVFAFTKFKWHALWCLVGAPLTCWWLVVLYLKLRGALTTSKTAFNRTPTKSLCVDDERYQVYHQPLVPRHPTWTLHRQSVQQEFFDEHYGCIETIIAVRFLANAVSFALHREIPDRGAVLPHCVHDLFRFRTRNDRIVFTLNDEQRFGDGSRVVQRCESFEEFTYLGIAFVAILHATKIAAIIGRTLQKCDQTGGTIDVDCAPYALRIVHGRYQRHVASIGCTANHHAVSIEIGLRLDPVKKRSNAFVGVLSQPPVVQGEKRLS